MSQTNPHTDASPNGPIGVVDNCWMVGHRDPSTLLQCNTYVRKFDHRKQDFNLCIDPGSCFDFHVIEKNVKQLVGDMDQIHGMTINHQDPDVAGNTPKFCEANQKAEMIVSEESWRLLQHMMLKPGRLRLANVGQSNVSVTGSFHLQLVPTPFCHFRGALAFYDPEIKTLFSGDLFGGLNRLGATHLMATEEDWSGIAQFHQIYMPSREVLRYAVRQILDLRPKVEVIAPQHGGVIAGELVGEFLERMHELRVGHDLLSDNWDSENLDGYRQVIERMISVAESTMGSVEVVCRLTATDVSDGLDSQLAYRDGKVRLEREGYTAVAKVYSRLASNESTEEATTMKDAIIEACSDLSLPVPPIEIGIRF